MQHTKGHFDPRPNVVLTMNITACSVTHNLVIFLSCVGHKWMTLLLGFIWRIYMVRYFCILYDHVWFVMVSVIRVKRAAITLHQYLIKKTYDRTDSIIYKMKNIGLFIPQYIKWLHP